MPLTTSLLPAPLGVQRPRVHNGPAFVSSAGAEAVELAAAAGLELDDWQAFVLEQAMGETADGRWAAFEVALIVPRQNGKGSVIEARELAGLYLLGEDLILHSAHEFKTAAEGFRRIMFLIENCPDLDRRVRKVTRSHGDEGVELMTGQRLRFVARTGGSGRGFSGDCVILDEAFRLDGRAMASLLPTLSARPNPQLWYASSAPMADSEQLHAVRKRGLAGGSPSLAYFEWSSSPELAPDDRVGWAQANPALGIRIPVEFVEREREAMPAEEFDRERRGISDDAETNAVIDLAVWAKRADPASTIDGPMAFALDVSPDRESAWISVAGRRADGAAHVELIIDDLNGPPRGTAWVVPRLAELVAKWNPCAVVLDPGSAAGSLIPALRDEGIEPLLMTARDVGQACGAFYDAVVDDTLRHLGQEDLRLALVAAKRRPLGEAWAWDRKAGAAQITPLVSATFALWGFTVRQSELVDVSESVW